MTRFLIAFTLLAIFLTACAPTEEATLSPNLTPMVSEQVEVQPETTPTGQITTTVVGQLPPFTQPTTLAPKTAMTKSVGNQQHDPVPRYGDKGRALVPVPSSIPSPKLKKALCGRLVTKFTPQQGKYRTKIGMSALKTISF